MTAQHDPDVWMREHAQELPIPDDVSPEPHINGRGAFYAGLSQPPTERPVIKVSGSAYVTNAEDAEQAILDARLPVFRRSRDHQLVRPLIVEDEASDGRRTTSAALTPISGPLMRQFMQGRMLAKI